LHPNTIIGNGVVLYPYKGTVVGETSIIGDRSVIHGGQYLDLNG
jgi:serine acetyltransferase